MQDAQLASKMLVDHALARFSTDNLSCMIVRFDNKAVQSTVERRSEPIGVEGDPPTKKGGISETEAIVMDAKIKVEGGASRPVSVLRESANPAPVAEENKAEPGTETAPPTAVARDQS